MTTKKNQKNVFAEDAKKAQQQHTQIVDKSVSSSMRDANDIVITTLRLPRDTHEALRVLSFESKESINTIILRLLQEKL